LPVALRQRVCCRPLADAGVAERRLLGRAEGSKPLDLVVSRAPHRNRKREAKSGEAHDARVAGAPIVGGEEGQPLLPCEEHGSLGLGREWLAKRTSRLLNALNQPLLVVAAGGDACILAPAEQLLLGAPAEQLLLGEVGREGQAALVPVGSRRLLLALLAGLAAGRGAAEDQAHGLDRRRPWQGPPVRSQRLQALLPGGAGEGGGQASHLPANRRAGAAGEAGVRAARGS